MQISTSQYSYTSTSINDLIVREHAIIIREVCEIALKDCNGVRPQIKYRLRECDARTIQMTRTMKAGQVTSKETEHKVY